MKIRYIIFIIAAVSLLLLIGCSTSVTADDSTTYTYSDIPTSADITDAAAYVAMINPSVKTAYTTANTANGETTISTVKDMWFIKKRIPKHRL